MNINTINTNLNFTSNSYTKSFKNGITLNITPQRTQEGKDIFVATVSNQKGKMLHTLKLAEEELKNSEKHLAVIKRIILVVEHLTGKGIYETCNGTYAEVKHCLKSNIKPRIKLLLTA